MERADGTSSVTRRQVLGYGITAAVAAGLWPSFRASALAQSSVIQLMSWEGYDFPGPMEEWKKKNGVEVQATYMGSHDDIQAKILGGGGAGLDLITYGNSYKEL